MDMIAQDQPSRSVTPDPTPTGKKLLNKRGKGKGSKGSESFQVPTNIPLVKKSSTINGTSRNQRPPTPVSAFNTPSGYPLNRRNSFETEALQIQLSNRQTNTFMQIVEDSNNLMMDRFTKMKRDGDREMLAKIEDLMKSREEKMENKISKQINGTENIITDKIIAVIKEEDRKLEGRITKAYYTELALTKEEITGNTNSAVGRLDGRLTNLEVTHKEISSELSTRLSISAKKEEENHTELLENLALMEELKTKVHSTGRRMEELSSNMTSELSRNKANIDVKFKEICATMNETSTTLTSFKSSLKQIETNSSAINEMQLAMAGMLNRLTTLEAENLTNMEKFSLHRARMDRLESNINTIDQGVRHEVSQNQYVRRMEVDDRSLNLIISGLPHEIQSVGGIIAFAFDKFDLHMSTSDIVRVYKVADTQRGPLVKVRFGMMEARTAFYKSRTKLGPNSTIWVNEDLSRANEVLAYQARKLALHKYLSRTWTYLGQVYIQREQNAEPVSVNKKEDLPHYEVLDSITTPLRSNARFRPNAEGTTVTPSVNHQYNMTGSPNRIVTNTGNSITVPVGRTDTTPDNTSSEASKSQSVDCDRTTMAAILTQPATTTTEKVTQSTVNDQVKALDLSM